MAVYLLDTNIVVKISNSLDFQAYLDRTFDLFNPNHFLLFSLVSMGEVKALNGRNTIGPKRFRRQQHFLETVSVIPLDERMIVPYANIDNFSLGKLPRRPSPDSAIKMGKNDLWIAATAVVEEAELITTDKDFRHLNGEFLTVHYVDSDAVLNK